VQPLCGNPKNVLQLVDTFLSRMASQQLDNYSRLPVNIGWVLNMDAHFPDMEFDGVYMRQP
jgi:hypothetical protein